MIKRHLIHILISAIIGGLVGSVTTFTLLHLQKPSSNELIREFYDIENAVHISPHSLRRMMNKGNQSYILIDLRSSQEYEKEHIIGAVNIPAYSDPDTSAYGDVDRIVNSFKILPKDKDIIVYCYSTPCMTGRKIGQMLTEHGIYVKHLGIGWNEWRYFWNLWNHEHEWDKVKVDDYITKGNDPGIPKLKSENSLSPCTVDDKFGC